MFVVNQDSSIITISSEDKVSLFQSKSYGHPYRVLSKIVFVFEILKYSELDISDFISELNENSPFMCVLPLGIKTASNDQFIKNYSSKLDCRWFYEISLDHKNVSILQNVDQKTSQAKISDFIHGPFLKTKDEILDSIIRLYTLGFKINGLDYQSLKIKTMLKI